MLIRSWLLVCMLGVASLLEGAPIYKVQDLGTLGGTTATAFAINGAGVAVGVASDPYGNQYAFSNFGSGMQTLPSNGADASASGVNNGGSVVGTVYANGQAQATVWQDGVATNVGAAGSYGMAINDAGQVTGSANGRAFLAGNGTMTDLGTLAGGKWSAGYSVNGSGQVAGYGDRGNGAFQAFLWTQATGLAAIAGLGGANSYAMSVNDAGVVAGSAQMRSGYMHAFVAAKGRTQDLGTLGGGSSYGYGVNNSGDVVGYSWTRYRELTHAFLYQGGVMWDLNDLIATTGWVLTEAYAINDGGQVVGKGVRDGVQHAVRLDLDAVVGLTASAPLVSGAAFDMAGAAGVPEPGAMGMVLAPLAGLLLYRRRRRAA